MGTGNRFDWSRLAANGVVVVAINYRLGALGLYYSSPAIRNSSVYIAEGIVCSVCLPAWFSSFGWLIDAC